MFTSPQADNRRGFHLPAMLLGLFLISVAVAQVDTAWVRRYNGPGNGTDDAQAVGVDASGNVYVAGYSLGSGTGIDYCLVKYDAMGVEQWARRFNGAANLTDYAYSLAVDAAGNCLVTGYSMNAANADFATVKYDTDGNQLWAAIWNDSLNGSDYATQVAIDGAGNVVVTGYGWTGTSYDFITIKYDRDGNELWHRYYNGPANNTDYATSVVTDAADNIIVGGYSYGTGYDYAIVKYDPSGLPVWSVRYNGTGNSTDYLTSLAVDDYGNVYGTGYSYGAAGADYDFATVKYDVAGNPAAGWPVRYNGPGNDYDEARSIKVDAAGYVYVCGSSAGIGTNADMCAICYSASGVEQWVRRSNGSANLSDVALQLALDTASNVYVTGYSNLTGLGYEWTTIKYNRAGDEQWLCYYGRPGAVTDLARTVKLDPIGNVYVAGYTTSSGPDFTVAKYMSPDVAIDLVTAPLGRYDTLATVVPAAVAHNYGTAPVTVMSWAWLATVSGTRVYSDSLQLVQVQPGETRAAVYDTWPLPHRLGQYRVRCSTYVACDRDRSNDTADAEFTISAGSPGWVEVRSVPASPSGREVKDGGSLSYCASNGLIYAVKGYKTGDFYSYNPMANVWVELQPVPPGPANKPLAKGAALCSDGGSYVYCVKGNNTEEFWRFSHAGGWAMRESVPLLPSGKKVKGGGDAAWAGGYMYFLKGYGTDFYRFNPASGHWETLPPAPAGYKPKYNKGSFIVSDGGRYVYACKAKYNELWRYDISARAWGQTQLAPMPFFGRLGKTKKLKDGGNALWYDGCIYALKGGNTQEFWCYSVATNSWREMDTIPAWGSTGTLKRVKNGGDIASAGFAFYAMKGGKTLEFWRYIPPNADGVAAATTQMPQPALSGRLRLSPNPCHGRVRLGLPADCAGVITVTDVSGRRAFVSTVAGRDATLDLRGLPAGVYMVRSEQAGSAATARLVVE